MVEDEINANNENFKKSPHDSLVVRSINNIAL